MFIDFQILSKSENDVENLHITEIGYECHIQLLH